MGTCLPPPPLSPPILKVTGVRSLVGIFHIFLPGLVITYKHKYSVRECLGFGLKFFCTLLFLLSSSSRKPFSVHLPQLGAASKAVNWTHHCLCSHSLTDKHSLCFQFFFAISDSAWTSSFTYWCLYFKKLEPQKEHCWVKGVFVFINSRCYQIAFQRLCHFTFLPVVGGGSFFSASPRAVYLS